MKKKFLLSVIGVCSILYLFAYPVASPVIVRYLFVVIGILFIILFLDLKMDRERNMLINIIIWTIFGSVFLIPRFFFEPDIDLTGKLIWAVIIGGAILYDAAKEFKWFSN